MAFDPDAYLSGSSSTATAAGPASEFDPDEYLKKRVFDPDAYLNTGNRKPETGKEEPVAAPAAGPPMPTAAGAEATVEPPPTGAVPLWKQIYQAGVSAGTGIERSVANTLKFMGRMSEATGAIDPNLKPDVTKNPFYALGKKIEEFSHTNEHVDPRLAQGGIAENVGGTVGTVLSYVASGPVTLPRLFADGFEQHKEAAEAKGQDGTNEALAGGSLNLALGLPVFRIAKGVAKAIAPDAAGAVRDVVQKVYKHYGLPGVDKLVGILQQSRDVKTWSRETAEGLIASLRELDKEVKKPITGALRLVIRNAAESAAIGGTVTTGHNLIAQNYDPERPTFQGVPEALLAFGALGALGATGEAVGRVRSARQAQEYLRQKYHEKPVSDAPHTSGARPATEQPPGNPMPPTASQSPPKSAAAAPISPVETTPPASPPAPPAGSGERPPPMPQSSAPAAASPREPSTGPAPDRSGPVAAPAPQRVSRPDSNLQSEIGNLQLGDAVISIAGTDVAKVATSAIAVRPELMQFKAIDQLETGENKNDEITAKYDPLKADNLLLWEPLDQAAYGLDRNQRYITADGHHRHSRAVKDGVEFQNAQILREADGYSASDARTVAAEKNIAGGKGTIFDQVKFVRNLAATHGADAALERAGQIGARGRKAATIALAAEPDLYASFINEQITPEAAAAIANVVPRDAGLQRLGIQRALTGEDPALTANFLQAVKAKMGTRAPTAQQVDLFAADDAALKAAEKAARRAHAIQKEIGEQITSVAGASRRPEKAKALGVDVRDAEAVAAKLVELQALRERARNWAMDDAMRDLAMSGEGTAADAVRKLQTAADTSAQTVRVEEEPNPYDKSPDPIVAATVQVRGQLFRAVSHPQAFDKAERHFGEKIDVEREEASIGFITRGKRLLTYAEGMDRIHGPRTGQLRLRELPEVRYDVAAVKRLQQALDADQIPEAHLAATRAERDLHLRQLRNLARLEQTRQSPDENLWHAGIEPGMNLETAAAFAMADDPAIKTWPAAIARGKALLENARAEMSEYEAEMREADLKLAQNYVADHDIPLNKRKEAADGIARTLSFATNPTLARHYEGNQGLLFDPRGETLAAGPAQGADPATPRRRPGPAKGDRERALSRRGLEALEAGNPEALNEALAANKNRVSTIIPQLISGERKFWDIVGSYIKTPADMMMAVQTIRSPYVESLKAAVIDRTGKVLASEVVHVGSLNESIAHPREIFRTAAILQKTHPGVRLIISHNHPSGDPTPSQTDHRLTKRLQEVADLLQIPLVDHVVTDGKKYYSFTQGQTLELEERQTQPWEIVPGDETVKLDSPDAFQRFALALRAGDPTAAHVIYLSTRLSLKAVERIPNAHTAHSLLIKAILRGTSREGAYGVIVDLPAPETTAGVAEQNDVTNRHLLRRISEALEGTYMVKLIDATWPGITSAYEGGYLARETPGEYGGGVREQPDFFEDQLAAAERRSRERSLKPKPAKPEQFDMFAGTEQDPFNLAGEKGVDWAARQAEMEAAERQTAEARELQAKAQPNLFASPEPPVLGDELQPPPNPADDPGFTALPVDLPEAVRFANELLGVAIQARKKIRGLRGQAAAGLSVENGVPRIHLRADIADLLTQAEKLQLAREATEYAGRMSEDPAEVSQIAQARYEFLLDQAYQQAKTKPPVMALKVIWHEIGHAVDWFPQKMITGRGNLFGHLAALKDYLKHTVALDPTQPAGKALSQKERRELFKEAEKQLREEFGPIAEIVETIIVEEPELRIVGITPPDIRNLFGMDARETMPELYRWFAEQPAEVKKEIVRKAMRDVLDDRLAALGKTEQVGVKRTKRTVRKKVGREPTVEEIAERFKKLFRDELRRRNLAHLAQVKEELRGAIAWWHGTPEMPAYFKGGTEMYAEAFSIFLNNPAALQKRAPAYARLLWNYLDARPEAGAIYNRIQNEIKAGQVEDNTEAAMLDSWDAADARSLELAQPYKTTWRDFLDNVSYHMDRRMGPIYRAAKGARLEPEARMAIGNFLYRAAEHELFLNRMNRLVGEPLVAAGLDWKDLGRYMFYKRVVEERFNIFNPYGIAPDRALKRLEKMRARMGPKQFGELEKAQLAFRELYDKHVINAMKEARMWNDQLQAAIERNVFYATFDVRQDDPKDGIAHLLDGMLGANVSPHIYRQVGTVKEIKNPATATILKSLSLISAASRNIAKRATIAMLRENDPQNVLEAEKRWTGKQWEFVPRENEHVGTVVYLDQGKPSAWYVRRHVADALNKGNSIDNRLVLVAARATSALKGLFTQLNYAFWPVNFVRDTFGFVMQMPGVTPLGWAREFPKALAAARASVKGRANPHAEAALQRRMLISRADPQGIWSAVDNEFELKLASYGLNPAMWDHQADRVHTLVKIWNSYRELGQTFERVNKIAGMNYLDRAHPHMPEWQKREIIRERAGSPDFLQRGSSTPYVDFFMMFYNPWKEGIRSVTRAARENPWSFMAKAVAFIVAPVVLQALASFGVFGDGRRRQYRSIPDYDLSNYLCLPLGWQNEEQGKVAYLRLPLWEPARILHGTLWQFITGRGQGLASFYGGTVPSMNSLLKVGGAWFTYEVMGHNPYDSFRGKQILSDTEFAAGGWQAREKLLKESWNSLGGSIAYRFQNTNLESPPQDRVEKFLQLPIVSNFLNRWVKVSNRGLDDADRQLTQPVQEYRARARLAVQEITRKILAQEALTDAEKHLLWDPYAMDYLRRTLPEVVTARSSPLSRRLQDKSPEEKALILQNAMRQ